MGFTQKLTKTILPKRWADEIEAESRRWIARCSCGNEQSIWEAGGIRWKAKGKKTVTLLCSRCNKTTEQALSFQTTIS